MPLVFKRELPIYFAVNRTKIADKSDHYIDHSCRPTFTALFILKFCFFVCLFVCSFVCLWGTQVNGRIWISAEATLFKLGFCQFSSFFSVYQNDCIVAHNRHSKMAKNIGRLTAALSVHTVQCCQMFRGTMHQNGGNITNDHIGNIGTRVQ
jgi:hypothetical protein